MSQKALLKIYRLLALQIGLLLLTACTINPVLTSEQRKAIHTVQLDKNVTMPKNMYFWNGKMNLILIPQPMFLPVESRQEGDELSSFLQQRHVVLEQIILQQLRKQLEQQKLFRIVDHASEADVVMRIEVKQYGFSLLNGFTTKLWPNLDLAVEMVKNDQVIWRKTEATSKFMDDIPRYSYADIKNNPQYASEMWSVAVKALLKNILVSLA
jgi:hypothetical protein